MRQQDLFHFALFCLSGVKIDFEKFPKFSSGKYSKWKGGSEVGCGQGCSVMYPLFNTELFMRQLLATCLSHRLWIYLLDNEEKQI